MFLKPITDIETFSKQTESQIGVFASKEWLAVYENKLHMVGIYLDEQQLLGAFYFLPTKKIGLSFIKLPPYTPHCALAYKHDSKNASSGLNFSKELIQAIVDYLEAQKFSLCVLAFPSHITDLQPFFWKGYKVVPNYTYRINLSQSIEQIQSNFDSKNRNVINKALKEQVVVQENVLSNEKLYDYFLDTLQKAGANVYTSELKAIFTKFANSDNSFAMQALHEGTLVGTVFCVYDQQTCYYLLAGIDKSSKIQGVNNLLVLKCIEKAKVLGCSVFDFEGSMLKGVERFFRSFGPSMVPYYTVNKANIFLEMALKFKKRATF